MEYPAEWLGRLTWREKSLFNNKLGVEWTHGTRIMSSNPDRLEVGLSPEAAIAAFQAACNQGADRLFITDSWFAPFRLRLLSALPPSLTEALVAALQDAVYKRRPLQAVVDFVEQQPITWEEFAQWDADREHRLHLQRARQGYFPWPDVEASANDEELQRRHRSHGQSQAPAILNLSGRTESDVRANARNCPGCGRPASELTWLYFSSPAWTWQQLCGRAGWLVVCTPCHLQVDFFLELMN